MPKASKRAVETAKIAGESESKRLKPISSTQAKDVKAVVAVPEKVPAPPSSYFFRNVLSISNEDNVADSIAKLQLCGSKITGLRIVYKIAGIKPLLDAILRFCGKNIDRIFFIYGYSSEALNDSVEKKTKAYTEGLKDFRDFLKGFAEHFPKLAVLDISYARPFDDTQHWTEIVKNFPRLTQLTIGQCKNFPIEDFAAANPQLRLLKLKNTGQWEMKQELLRSIDKHLPKLTGLVLEFKSDETAVLPFNSKDWFNRLTSLEICTDNRTYSSALEFVNISGRSLDSLIMYVSGDFDDKALPMVKRYGKLRRLDINAQASSEQVIKFAEELPTVEKFSISLGKIKPMGIIRATQIAQQLTRFSCYPWGSVHKKDIKAICDPLKKKFNNEEWQVIDAGDGIITIKKLITG